ncbi:TPA: glycosyltransferase family 4 protein [Vibrio parahaemolyticus]
MNILIVSSSDINGGAARAAYRLHKSLLMRDINSQMLVLNKSSDDFSVLGPDSKYEKIKNAIKPIIDSVPVRLHKNRSLTPFSTSWIRSDSIVKKINELNPDIVHLHWINGGMIRIEDLTKIKAPIVWSLHDMWAFTGGCHYNENCNNFKNVCGKCSVLRSSRDRDLSNWVFKRKRKAFKNINRLVIVGLSKWLADCAKESMLLKNVPVINLPNPIDTEIFKLSDKDVARDLWNLPKNKKLVLFGAMGATSDPRKGFKELSSAFDKIERDDVEFVVFGASEPSEPPKVGCKVNYVGCLSDQISLVSLYNAVDVMVVPSLQENLSNAIMESLSCGTPVIAFDIGGNSDLIEHKINGYLAKPFSGNDLAHGIDWVLGHEQYLKICKNARKKVIAEFESNVVSCKYIDLYKKCI